MAFILNGKAIGFQAYEKLNEQACNSGLDLQFVDQIIQLTRDWYNDEVSEFCFMTSGSTGPPSTVCHSRTSVCKSLDITQKYFGYKRADKSFLALPLKYVAGSIMLLRALHNDLDLLLNNISSNPFEKLDQKIDFVAVTPMQLNNCLLKNPQKLELISTILLGGSPVSIDMLQSIGSIDSAVYHSYGMTETITHVALRKLNGLDATEYYVSADEEIWFECNDDQRLIIHAGHLDGPLLTNDVVELLDNKSFFWKHRWDTVINSGGIKIHPAEVESYFNRELGLNTLAWGKKDEILGEKLVLLVESCYDESLVEQIRMKLSQLELKQRPRLLSFMDRFCYTATMKIDRKCTFDSIQNENLYQL